jgi:hypothetical protein
MAVTLTDRRTLHTEADSTTNWTGAGYGTTTSDIAESNAAVAESLASTSGNIYYAPGGTISLSTTCIYIYAFNNALQDSWDNNTRGGTQPPVGIYLSDGTDAIAFDMAGVDRRVFNHLEGPTSWQCLVLDGAQASAMNTAGNTEVISGTFAGLDLASITQVGCSFDTNSKALGGGYNVAVDIIRYGNDGIRLTAGTTGDRGVFSEIAAADRGTGNQQGHGVFRELQPVAFGCQAPLTFGDSGAATTCYFEDSNAVIVFEDRNISDGIYYFNVEGNSGATNLFSLTGCTITTAGPNVSCNFDDANIDTFSLTNCSFIDLASTIDFAADTGHTVTGCTFDGCGVINAGSVDFLNNLVTNSTASGAGVSALVAEGGDMTGTSITAWEGTSDESALNYDLNADPDGKLDDMSFTKGTASTHAIEFGDTVPTTMTLRGISFSGYNASDSQNDSTLYFAEASGAVTYTVNLIGCTGNISYKSAGATIVLVNNPVPLTVNVNDIVTGEALQNARVLVETAPVTRVRETFESGIGNWQQNAADTDTFDTVATSTDWAHKGRFSLEAEEATTTANLYRINSGSVSGGDTSEAHPVTHNEEYRVTATVRTASDHTSTVQVNANILWYNSSGTFLSTSNNVANTGSVTSSTTYDIHSGAGTTAPTDASPTNQAAYAVVQFSINAGASTHLHYYIDGVLFERIADTGWPYNLQPTSITRSTDTATVTLTAHGLSTDDWVTIKGATAEEYNGVFQITKTGDNTFTYTSSELSAGAPATPATGYPITVTLAIIQGKTDASGQISATRSYSPDNQPITGRVRLIKEVQP